MPNEPSKPSSLELPASVYVVPAWLNLGALVVLFAAVFLAFALPTLWPGSVPALLLGALAFGILIEPTFALAHEAFHGLFHPKRFINAAAGLALCALMPTSFRFHRLAHIGHHAFNRSRRERVEYWTSAESRVRQTAIYYGALLGLMWLNFIVQNLVFTLLPVRVVRRFRLDRRLGLPMPAMTDRDLRVIALEFSVMVLLHVLVVALTPVTWQQMVLYRFAGALSYSNLRHVVHYGASFHVVEGAFDLVAHRTLTPLLLHGNYHLAHHRYARVPWLHLPLVSRPEDRRHGYLRMVAAQWRGVLDERAQLLQEGRLDPARREDVAPPP